MRGAWTLNRRTSGRTTYLSSSPCPSRESWRRDSPWCWWVRTEWALPPLPIPVQRGADSPMEAENGGFPSALLSPPPASFFQHAPGRLSGQRGGGSGGVPIPSRFLDGLLFCKPKGGKGSEWFVGNRPVSAAADPLFEAEWGHWRASRESRCPRARGCAKGPGGPANKCLAFSGTGFRQNGRCVAPCGVWKVYNPVEIRAPLKVIAFQAAIHFLLLVCSEQRSASRLQAGVERGKAVGKTWNSRENNFPFESGWETCTPCWLLNLVKGRDPVLYAPLLPNKHDWS